MALLRVPGASWWSTPSPRIAARWHKGLKVAWTGAGKTQLLVPPVRATAIGLKRFQQTKYGPAYSTTDLVTGSCMLLPGSPKLTTTDNITIFMLTREYGSSSWPSEAYCQRDAANGAFIGLGFNRSNTGSTSSGEVVMRLRSTSVVNRGCRLDNVLPRSGARVWNSVAICHLTGSSYRNSVNGRDWASQGGVVSATAPSGTIYTVDQVSAIGGNPHFTESVREPLALVFAWERAFSQEELDEITRDPSVLFEEDVLWVPASAGGSLPTLSLATTTNITATTATLGLTLTF